MDKELREQICDYFTAAELVELLGVSTTDLLECFDSEGYLDDNVLADLKEIMGVKDGSDTR